MDMVDGLLVVYSDISASVDNRILGPYYIMPFQLSGTGQRSTTRTLHEWHDFIVRSKRRKQWKEVSLGAIWLQVRQAVRRAAKIGPIRTWWTNARTHANHYADLVAEWTGRSRMEQLRQMAWLTLRHGVSPKAYYSYKLYRPDRFEKAGLYIYHEPKVRLNKFLVDLTRDRVSFDMKDKRNWFRWALNHNVPTPRPVVFFDKGEVQNWWNDGYSSLPDADLFSIWVDVYRGEGAQAWSFENGRYVDVENSSASLTEEELIARLSEKSRERPVVLMERVRNHSEWQGFTSGGLATCRFVTGRFPEERPEPIVANLKMPRDDSIVDDISAGGLAAPVDLHDGTLGPAVTGFPEPLGDWVHAHPDTKADITGAELPFWSDVVDLAVTTHQKMPNAPFVGWDVTVTVEGPIIVEPNDGWGASTAEKPGGVPLSHTIYQDMYDSWITNFNQ